jgi:hypothetical protein
MKVESAVVRLDRVTPVAPAYMILLTSGLVAKASVFFTIHPFIGEMLKVVELIFVNPGLKS